MIFKTFGNTYPRRLSIEPNKIFLYIQFQTYFAPVSMNVHTIFVNWLLRWGVDCINKSFPDFKHLSYRAYSAHTQFKTLSSIRDKCVKCFKFNKSNVEYSRLHEYSYSGAPTGLTWRDKTIWDKIWCAKWDKTGQVKPSGTPRDCDLEVVQNDSCLTNFSYCKGWSPFSPESCTGSSYVSWNKQMNWVWP